MADVTFTILRIEYDLEHLEYDSFITMIRSIPELIEWKTMPEKDYKLYWQYVNNINYQLPSGVRYVIVSKVDFERTNRIIDTKIEVNFDIEHIRAYFNAIEEARKNEIKKREEAERKKKEAAARRKLEKAALKALSAAQLDNLKDLSPDQLATIIKEGVPK